VRDVRRGRAATPTALERRDTRHDFETDTVQPHSSEDCAATQAPCRPLAQLRRGADESCAQGGAPAHLVGFAALDDLDPRGVARELPLPRCGRFVLGTAFG